MISGSLAVLDSPREDILEDYHDSGQRAIDVSTTQAGFDGKTVQTGTIAGKVPQRRQVVTLDGHRIDEETKKRETLVASEWVADVAGSGWIVCESTHSTGKDFGPPWPYSAFQTIIGREISPVEIDPGAFAKRQEDNDRDTVVEFVGRKKGKDDVSINWGNEAKTQDAIAAELGVALTTLWNGEFVRVIVYQSGFTAAWEPEDWAPSAFARFVDEEILPVCYVPEDGDEGEQATLDDHGVEREVRSNLGEDSDV